MDWCMQQSIRRIDVDNGFLSIWIALQYGIFCVFDIQGHELMYITISKVCIHAKPNPVTYDYKFKSLLYILNVWEVTRWPCILHVQCHIIWTW